jgi:hypothetical protein
MPDLVRHDGTVQCRATKQGTADGAGRGVFRYAAADRRRYKGVPEQWARECGLNNEERF